MWGGPARLTPCRVLYFSLGLSFAFQTLPVVYRCAGMPLFPSIGRRARICSPLSPEKYPVDPATVPRPARSLNTLSVMGSRQVLLALVKRLLASTCPCFPARVVRNSVSAALSGAG